MEDHSNAAGRVEGEGDGNGAELYSFDSTAAGAWAIRLQTGEHVFSQRSRQLLGIDEGETVTVQRFLAALHTDDRQRWKDAVARSLDAEGDGEIRLELRTTPAIGRRLAISGRVCFDGINPVRLFGAVVEVSAPKPKVHVLLAEDDDAMRELLVEQLEGNGYDVVDLEDGYELRDYLSLVRQDGRVGQPDVVVCDMKMPGVDGLSAVEGFAACDRVVLISGFVDRDTVARARKLGVRAVLSKPFTIEELLGEVERVRATV